MLVLTRRIDERIVVGENVEIIVIGCQSGRVKLGFVAPPEVPIRRGEKLETVDGPGREVKAK